MIHGNHYVRHGLNHGFEIASESDDDDIVVTGVPFLKLAEEIRDLINSWRRDITVTPSPPPEK